jgi:hypothetical protein
VQRHCVHPATVDAAAIPFGACLPCRLRYGALVIWRDWLSISCSLFLRVRRLVPFFVYSRCGSTIFYAPSLLLNVFVVFRVADLPVGLTPVGSRTLLPVCYPVAGYGAACRGLVRFSPTFTCYPCTPDRVDGWFNTPHDLVGFHCGRGCHRWR